MMSRTFFLRTVSLVVAINYLAQVPYYLHQYYARYHTAPSALGMVLLALTLIWMVLGVVGLGRGSVLGYLLLISFLSVEFLFYLQTQIVQLISGHGVLLYVIHPSDPFLFIVFGIGYINFVASGWFVYYLATHRAAFARKATER